MYINSYPFQLFCKLHPDYNIRLMCWYGGDTTEPCCSKWLVRLKNSKKHEAKAETFCFLLFLFLVWNVLVATEALRRRCLLCCAHWQIRQKEGALKLFYSQITHLFNNYITNYVSLFIFKATPLLKGSRKQGLTCLSTTWSKKSRISWMETQSISCWKWSHMGGKATITDWEMETSCWIIIPPPL